MQLLQKRQFNYSCGVQAGNYVRDDVVSCTIQLVSESTSQQGYIVEQLWRALERDTMDRQPLTQVATWCIGEYGDLLLYGPSSSEDNPIRVSVKSERIFYFTRQVAAIHAALLDGLGVF